MVNPSPAQTSQTGLFGVAILATVGLEAAILVTVVTVSPSCFRRVLKVPTVTGMGRPGVAILVTVITLGPRVVLASEKVPTVTGKGPPASLVTVITLRPSCRLYIARLSFVSLHYIPGTSKKPVANIIRRSKATDVEQYGI